MHPSLTRLCVLSLPVLTAFTLSACTSTVTNMAQPNSLGEQSSSYGYVPLDGLAVDQRKGSDSCTEHDKSPFAPLAESLPDINVRFAVASFDSSGSLTFGPVSSTAKNKSYRAILDYINVDVVPLTFRVMATTTMGEYTLSQARSDRLFITGYKVALIPNQNQNPNNVPLPKSTSSEGDEVTIPVYVGVGLRLTADITALEGSVPIVSLGAIGVGAEAKSLIGTLTVQTLGISGPTVSASLPLPSKLDQTTIENAVMAVGANRKEIYAAKNGETGPVPRVVGLYSPIGTDSRLINALYSEISKNRTVWNRLCSPLTAGQSSSHLAMLR